MPGVVVVEVLEAGEGIAVTESQINGLLYEEDIWGSARYALKLVTQSDAPWKDFLQNPELRFKIRFKHYADGQQSISAAKTLRKDYAKLTELGDNTEILLEGSDAGFDLVLGWKDSQVYKGTVSQMVGQIAERHKLKTDLVATTGTHYLLQCTYPDGWFIRNILLPLAYNDSRSDYLFYIRNGDTVVFRPPDLDKEVAKFVIPPRGEVDGIVNVEFHEFDIRDSSLTPSRSQVVQVRGFDRLTKRYIEFRAQDNTVNPQTLASTAPDPTVDPTRAVFCTAPFHPTYDERDVKRFGSALWSQHMRTRYSVSLNVRGFLAIVAGDMFKVDVQHWLGGRYLCSGVRQWMDEKTLDLWTTIVGQRREHN